MMLEWTLQRNCAMTPRQVACAYALLCAGSLSVGMAVLVLHGIWVVLAFSLVELALVGLALLVYARHATDREHIALSDACLLIESIEADRRQASRLDPLRTRVSLCDRPRRALIRLESRGVEIEVGRFVTEARRRQVERELRQALRSLSAMR